MYVCYVYKLLIDFSIRVLFVQIYTSSHSITLPKLIIRREESTMLQ